MRALGMSLAIAILGTGLFGLSEFYSPRAIAHPAGETERIQEALETLRRLPSGATLLNLAKKQWPDGIAQAFRWGPVSKTDAIITRYYNPDTGEERRSRTVSIILRQDQALEELVLDMAHEIVHATSRPAWDPYDASLTAARYIQTAIEGPGGEVEAVIGECKVNLEMAERFGTGSDRCLRYVEPGKGISRERVLAEFYRVGRWSKGLERKLGSDFVRLPHLSSESPKLYSSTGHTPYPVALFDEYSDLTRIACQNSRRRLSMRPAASSRSPAMQPSENFLRSRCR